jgi:hypothetical protein
VLFGDFVAEKHENVIKDKKDPKTGLPDAIYDCTHGNKPNEERDNRENQKRLFPVHIRSEHRCELPYT